MTGRQIGQGLLATSLIGLSTVCTGCRAARPDTQSVDRTLCSGRSGIPARYARGKSFVIPSCTCTSPPQQPAKYGEDDDLLGHYPLLPGCILSPGLYHQNTRPCLAALGRSSPTPPRWSQASSHYRRQSCPLCKSQDGLWHLCRAHVTELTHAPNRSTWLQTYVLDTSLRLWGTLDILMRL